MVLDRAHRNRVLERYRVFFRITGAMAVVGALFTLFGLLWALNSSETLLLGFGLIVLALSGLNGYKVVHSTMRILEEDAQEHGWQRFA